MLIIQLCLNILHYVGPNTPPSRMRTRHESHMFSEYSLCLQMDFCELQRLMSRLLVTVFGFIVLRDAVPG